MVKQELLAFAQQRKMQFEDGEPFHFHSLANTEEAMALVEAAEKEVTDIQDQVGERGGGVYRLCRESGLAYTASLFRDAKTLRFAETDFFWVNFQRQFVSYMLVCFCSLSPSLLHKN